MGAEIKSPPTYSSYCFLVRCQIYHFVSPLYPNKANKTWIWTTLHSRLLKQQKGLKIKSNQQCMAEIMQQLDEMLRQVHPFDE
jgi:hypothetical protein